MGLYINPSGTGLPPYFSTQPISTSSQPAEASFGIQPQNALVNSGSTANFYIESGSPDGGSLTYQWQYSTDGGTVFNNVSTGTGGTTNSYTTEIVNNGYNGRKYRCLVTNTKTGLTVAFTSVATDPDIGQTVSYQWYTSAGSSSALPNTANATLSSSSTGMTGSNPATGTYYVRASDNTSPVALFTDSNTVTATIRTTTNNPSASATLLVDPSTQLPTTWLLSNPQYGTVVWGLQTSAQSKLKPYQDNYNTHTVGTGSVTWEDISIPTTSALIQFNYAFECVSQQYLSTTPTAQTSSIEISYDDGVTFVPLYDYSNNRPLSQSSANGSVGPYAFSIQTPTISNLSQVGLRIGISADYDELLITTRPSTFTSTPATSTTLVTYTDLANAYSGSGVTSGITIDAINQNQVATVIYSGFQNLASTPSGLVLYVTDISGNVMDGSTQPSAFGVSVSTTGLNGAYTSLYINPNPGSPPYPPYDILPYSLPTNISLSNLFVKITGTAGRVGGEVLLGFGQIYTVATTPNWKASSRAILTDIKALY